MKSSILIRFYSATNVIDKEEVLFHGGGMTDTVTYQCIYTAVDCNVSSKTNSPVNTVLGAAPG